MVPIAACLTSKSPIGFKSKLLVELIMVKDLYNLENKIKNTKQKFKDECKRCYRILVKFEKALFSNSYKPARVLKYWAFLRRIHRKMGVCFDKAKKEDIERLLVVVNSNPNYSEWSKNDYKIIIKFFFRWLIYGTLEGEYPDIVKWIKPKRVENSLNADMILTKREIEQMASKTNNPRDRALVLTLYETGCRIGELLNMKIKNISFDEYGCRISVTGKTGNRRVRLIEYSKDLLAWLDSHPFKNNPESYVWVCLNKPSPEHMLSTTAVNNLLKDLARRCNISKPIHPHVFRHARATHLAKHLPEAIMKQLFGWTQDSKMAGVYYHLSGKDVDEALLRMHGIKQEEIKENKASHKVCQRCGEINSILTHFCKKCNAPLDIKIMLEMEEQRQRIEDFVKEFFVFYANKDSKFKKALYEFVKEKKAFDLFEMEKK